MASPPSNKNFFYSFFFILIIWTLNWKPFFFVSNPGLYKRNLERITTLWWEINTMLLEGSSPILFCCSSTSFRFSLKWKENDCNFKWYITGFCKYHWGVKFCKKKISSLFISFPQQASPVIFLGWSSVNLNNYIGRLLGRSLPFSVFGIWISLVYHDPFIEKSEQSKKEGKVEAFIFHYEVLPVQNMVKMHHAYPLHPGEEKWRWGWT